MTNMIAVSMETGPFSWFTPAEINVRTYDLLIDFAASQSVVSQEVSENLPESRPIFQNTNMKFEVANQNLD